MHEHLWDPRPRHRDLRLRTRAAAALALAGLLAFTPPPAHAQPVQMLANPVYVDEPPAAIESQVRVRELLASGNTDEAARVLQSLLDNHADAVIAADEPETFISVRQRVHALLAASPDLLARYRAQFNARAEALADQPELVERTLLLTPGGFDAALRLAQGHIESARFHAARFTLDQLETHPDAQGPRARNLAELWSLLSRYLDRADVKAAATRWREKAGLPAGLPAPITWPAPALAPLQSVFAPAPGLARDGLVDKPLWSVEHALQPRSRTNQARMRRARFATLGGLPIGMRELNVLPAASGDLVLINPGTRILAWDRFTLAPRWTVLPAGPAPAAEDDEGRMEARGWAGMTRSEDPSTLTVRTGLVLAATADSDVGLREGPRRVSAIDAESGEIRWTRTLAQIDPALEQGVVRGPVELAEQTAVFAVRRADDRRLITLSLVGLDAFTGETRWIRPVASTGSMPWIAQSSGAETLSVVDGIVFRADRLGVMAAVEAASGRTRWIRRAQVDPVSGNEPPSPFQIGSACVLDGRVFTLTPDARNIIAIEGETGRLLATRSTADMGASPPRYLLMLGRTLTIVSDDRVRFVDADDLARGLIRASQRFDDPGIRGRVSVAGDALLVPTTTALLTIRPDDPENPTSLTLEDMGNPLALESQLVVVDDTRLHSYLGWDTAERILRSRMKDRPTDAQPAITLAELAFRAGKLDDLVPAIDAAAAAFKAAPPADAAPESAALPDRLFTALHGMVIASLEPVEPPQTLDAAAKALSDRADVLASVVDRLGAIAQTPVQRVAHALAAGRLAEIAKNPAGAVAAYQRVLDDPALAGATWSGPTMSIRGEIEAARRIETLLQTSPDLYAPFDQQALAARADLGLEPTVAQLEGVAARYPFARQTPELWRQIAALHTAQSRPLSALAALEMGLRSARRLPSPDLAVVGRIAGDLVLDLEQRGQIGAAAGILSTVRTRYPGIALSSAAGPLDGAALDERLSARLAASQRWPRVGPLSASNIQTITEHIILEPLLESPTPAAPGALVLASDTEVSLWVPRRPAGAAPAPGEAGGLLRRVSGVALKDREARLLRITGDTALVLMLGAEEASIVKLTPAGIEPAWSTEFLARCFTSTDPRGIQNAPGVRYERFVMPSDETAALSDLLVAMDARTVVVAQRSGRVAAIDADTGELLWHADSGIARVFDCDVSGSHLVIAGASQERGPAGEPRAAIKVLEARTGKESVRPVLPASPPHWVRLTDSGGLVVAADDSVALHDLSTGQINWTLRDEDTMPARAGWVIGDRLILLSQNRTLLLASLSAGRLRPEPLGVPAAILEQARSVAVRPMRSGSSAPFMVSSQAGVAFLSAEGDLTGADGLNASTSLLAPVPSEQAALSFDTIPDGPAPEGLSGFAALRFQSPSGLLSQRQTVLLGARPIAMAVLDGLVAVNAGSVTLVFDAAQRD